MRTAPFALWLLLTGAFPAAGQDPVAADAPPSEALIREILVVTQAERLLDGVYGQVDAVMKQSMQDAVSGQNLTAEQDRLLAELRERIAALFQEQMSWRKMEPMMIDIYRKSFTQHELEGMLAFYRSEAGAALIAKMPVVMRHTMEAMQRDMQALAPRLREIQDDIMNRMRAAAPPPGPAP